MAGRAECGNSQYSSTGLHQTLTASFRTVSLVSVQILGRGDRILTELALDRAMIVWEVSVKSLKRYSIQDRVELNMG